MKTRLDLEPLEKEGLDRKGLVEALRYALGTTREVATLRLNRALSDTTESYRRDLLVALYKIAREYGIPWSEILLFEQDLGPFRYLPEESTYTYLGGYGPVEDEERRYADTTMASIADLRAARRFAHYISRDFSRLRFAPSVGDEEIRIVRELEEITVRSKGDSILSIGSSKVNTMSEWVMARALTLTPFRRRSPAQAEPPVEFVYAVTARQRQALQECPNERCNAKWEDAEKIGHSHLVWNGAVYRYEPPPDPKESTLNQAKPPWKVGYLEAAGRDFAVVMLEPLAPARGNVVVSGLTGAGTFGTSALLCAHPELFEVPPVHPEVWLFLVEIKVVREFEMRLAKQGRVLERWKGSDPGGFEQVADSEFKGLGAASGGTESDRAMVLNGRPDY